MHIHRSAQARCFSVLPNALLQDRRLSYTARGLLGDLLSRPDGWREDGRQMADRSPQGRLAISRALRELTEAGYYRVDKVRRSNGTFVSQAHVYDTPQVVVVAKPPALTRPGTGPVGGGGGDGPPLKNREKEPTSLPARRGEAARGRSAAGAGSGLGSGSGAGSATGSGSGSGSELQLELEPEPEPPSKPRPRPEPRPGPEPASRPDGPIAEAAALLFRVIRPEPRLQLGVVEALALAPLVVAWQERGCTQTDLAGALLPGLPERLHSAAALLRDRLVRKLPPFPEPVPPPLPCPAAASGAAPRTAGTRWFECGVCAAPVPQVGICRACAGLDAPSAGMPNLGRAAVTARGAALVRAAMRPGAARG